MQIRKDLEKQFPVELVQILLESYKEVETSFQLKKWKESEMDAGLFVEAARRLIEYKLFGEFTKIGLPLPNFNDQEIARYEKAEGDSNFRSLIPRTLKSIYNFRNKRGVGHISLISPNEMDATYILGAVKWVLAELTRVSSTEPPDKIQSLITKIVQRQVALVWNNDHCTRILLNEIPIGEKVLILLYNESPLYKNDLQKLIEISDFAEFHNAVKQLHSQRYIDEDSRGECIISPTGILKAEELIMARNN